MFWSILVLILGSRFYAYFARSWSQIQELGIKVCWNGSFEFLLKQIINKINVSFLINLFLYEISKYVNELSIIMLSCWSKKNLYLILIRHVASIKISIVKIGFRANEVVLNVKSTFFTYFKMRGWTAECLVIWNGNFDTTIFRWSDDIVAFDYRILKENSIKIDRRFIIIYIEINDLGAQRIQLMWAIITIITIRAVTPIVLSGMWIASVTTWNRTLLNLDDFI